MRYQIGDKLFKSQESIKKYTQEVLRKYRGQTLDANYNEDTKFIYHLCRRHPKWDDNWGFRAFEIGKSWGNDGSTLTLINKYGEKCPISWNNCIAVKPANYLIPAMRACIATQIIIWKRNIFIKNCELCGANFNEVIAHVDHYPKTFKEIKDEFLKLHPPPKDIRYQHHGHSGVQFHDDSYSYGETWYNFHKSKATYRLICATCNTTRTNK